MRFFAVDDDGATGNLYGQLMTGTAPVNNTRFYDDADVTQFLDVNGTVTERTISTPFVGASTGSALIGAYGLGMEAADTSASDIFFDLSDTQRVPPNNVTFTVLGLVSGEDRVLVTTDDGGDIDVDQYTLGTTLNGAAETDVDVTTVESETPSSGTIRIERDSGNYTRHPFSASDADSFTITSANFASDNATAGNNVYVSYIDLLATGTSEAFTYVYNADRTLFIRARDGGGTPIVTFESTGTMTNTGGSITIIRTSDA